MVIVIRSCNFDDNSNYEHLTKFRFRIFQVGVTRINVDQQVKGNGSSVFLNGDIDQLYLSNCIVCEDL